MPDAKRVRAAKKAAQTKLKIKYQKEQMRLLDFQRELELSGYRFEGSPLPKTPKKITAGSVRKLQNITPEYILKNATFLDDETGRVVGALTQYEKEPPVLLPPPVTKVVKPKTKKGRRSYKRKKRRSVKREDLLINNFDYMLSQIEVARPEEARYLRSLLNEEIKQYGKNAIARQLADIPQDELRGAFSAIYRYGKDHPVGGKEMQKIYMWITGTIPSYNDVKEMGEIAYLDDFDNGEE